MRTIHRNIVGGFIFSKDNKMLLGKNRSGGVYEGSFVVPGGGVDDGESNESALKREMLEETGIDIAKADVSLIGRSKGKHEKTLRDTKERVIVEMVFYNYRIYLDQNSAEVEVKAEDDWTDPKWFNLKELPNLKLSEPTRRTLVEEKIISV